MFRLGGWEWIIIAIYCLPPVLVIGLIVWLVRKSRKPTEPTGSDSDLRIASLEKNINLAMPSVILGAFSLIAWFYPLCGFPVSILGLYFGITSSNTSRRSVAIGGIILSLVGLLATTVNSTLGAYLGARGELFSTPTVIHKIRPTATREIRKTSVPENVCYLWDEITPSMAGNTVCFRGVITALISNNKAITRYEFSNTPNTFFLFSRDYEFYDPSTGKTIGVGTCIEVESTVILQNSVPYMNINADDQVLFYEDPAACQ